MAYSFYRTGLLFLTVFLSGISGILAQSGQIRGRVVDASTREPLVGATVFVPSKQAGAYTNDQGIYSFKVNLSAQSEELEVIAFYFGYDTTRQVITLENNDIQTVGIVLQEKMVYADEVEIIGKKTGEIAKTEVDAGVTSISPQEIKLIPSVGSADLAQFLQVLPGVVFTGDQGGRLYIRGGTPIQNMVLMDGMIIYSPFHSIGLFSVFDPDYIRSVDVYSAAFPGQYGGRTSSVIDINTRNGNFKNFSGKLDANPFMASALLEGPIGKTSPQGGGLSYMVSARNNFIDRTAKTVYPYVNDSTGLPYNFLDLYGKLSLTDGINYASLFGFRQTDNVNFEFPADIGWEAYGGGANFQLLPSDAGAIVSGSFAYSQYTTSLKSQTETFPRRSSIKGFNGTLKVGYIFNSVDEFAFGMTFLGFRTDYLFTNSFGLVTEQVASNTEAAAYLLYKKVIQTKNAAGEIFDRAVIEPSLRLHYYNNQSRPQVEPRIRMKLNLPRVSLSAAGGMYSQNLLAAISDRDVVNLFQGFLSAPSKLDDRIKRTTLQHSWHALGGVELELLENLSTSVETWVKDFTQLTNINRDKIFPEDPDYITETGKAFGFDFILKYQTPKVYFYSNYGWAKVTRTDRLQTTAPRTYPTVFDRRHTVNVVGAYKVGRFGFTDNDGFRTRPKFNESIWEFSLRWTMGSGFPFTQTQGYFEKLDFRDNGALTDLSTQNGNLGLILSDDLNGGRLPYYHRLDLSAKRRWILGNHTLMEVNASLINTYNRKNIFYFDRIAFEPVYQLPIIPSLGITLRY
ncbi:MAG: TonB-dependent receptor [Bacteroidia bacterium]|nr:TonB-dependent receptor [Bacteroidia bacterium]